MHWKDLLSLKRQGDTKKRLRTDQNHLRSGFEVDYDRGRSPPQSHCVNGCLLYTSPSPRD